MAQRYAIYFVPGAETALYRFGSSSLGYDCYTGHAIPFPAQAGPDWPTIVRAPAVYGFHATLKAPFRLAPGAHENDLLETVRAFAADQPVIDGGRLTLRALGSFIALVPAVPSANIDQFAARCVKELDSFRAPLTADERNRRLDAGLTAAQIELLDRWGYPYVFDEFRFHMTLTGALDPDRRAEVMDVLTSRLQDHPGATDLMIDRIVIARQEDTAAPFRVMATAALGHPVHRPYAYSF
jgi:putative phosphonate metabolism protein